MSTKGGRASYNDRMGAILTERLRCCRNVLEDLGRAIGICGDRCSLCFEDLLGTLNRGIDDTDNVEAVSKLLLETLRVASRRVCQTPAARSAALGAHFHG